MALPQDRLLTIAEVADFCRTSVDAIYMQRHRGEAPGALALKIGKRLRWRPETLEAWLESLEREGADR